MRKIMLVVDDYQDLVALENLLRRLGFDVMSLGKELLVNDALLRFQADFIIASAKGRNVDGYRLAVNLRKRPSPPRVALLIPIGSGGQAHSQMNNETQMAVDALIEAPVQPKSVIQVTARICGLDPAPLMAKWEKLTNNRFPAGDSRDARKIIGGEEERETSTHVSGRAPNAPNLSRMVTNDQGDTGSANSKSESTFVQGSIATKLTERTERSDRYDQFLRDHDVGPVDRVLPKAIAEKAMKQLKKDSEGEKSLLDQINNEKRAFAKALFETGHEVESGAHNVADDDSGHDSGHDSGDQ